jgi:hypothetical protein
VSSGPHIRDGWCGVVWCVGCSGRGGWWLERLSQGTMDRLEVEVALGHPCRDGVGARGGCANRRSISSRPYSRTMASVITAPSLVMRSLSHRGTRPP